jgi:hypothetical protein
MFAGIVDKAKAIGQVAGVAKGDVGIVYGPRTSKHADGQGHTDQYQGYDRGLVLFPSSTSQHIGTSSSNMADYIRE